MTAREWKPGDVAVSSNHGYRSMYVKRCSIVEHGRSGGACWHNESGLSDPPFSPRRPLVVIDPEDREQVERLFDLFDERFKAREQGKTVRDDLQAALREFANPMPPKPDEPQGLGAVVEDAHGRAWVRIAGDDDPGHPKLRANLSPPWRCRGKSAKWWEHLDAVCVLSEGVTND